MRSASLPTAYVEPLYTAAEMRAAEEGHEVQQLMERAGRAVADAILTRFPAGRTFAAVCGRGANGGDGRIAAELLRSNGWEERSLGEADVVVDALFGTGFRGAPREEAVQQIRAMNDVPAPVVAVDIPSGVDASTGEVPGEAVVAELTVTFHGRKVGNEVAPGRFHRGDVVVADIGLEPAETEHALVTPDILELVPRRKPGDTKYTAGSVLVVGGSPGLTGAACLTAEAAFRADAGYVAVAAPRESLPVVESRLLEAVKRPLEEVWDAVARAGALAIGPGLGREQAVLVRRLLEETDVPAVVDADALYELEPFERAAETVLTPHSGELGRLLGEEASSVDAHRLEALRRAVERFGCVVLLKGEGTLVGAPGAGALVCGGFAVLATAGTGDVLTGVIAAFLAKGMDARLAAAAGSVAHTQAALAAPYRSGLVASDLLTSLPRVLDA
ncbi:MAG TPA: NAD(P)H-hydrate dehydratase [Gaiellaceae bacterium]|nr:NAD(P)H-hydrate dehydratase [Gaiellaceae bacterium]